jgi:ASC-1-like (ASCH) protein
MNKEIKIIKCGLFRKVTSGNTKVYNICIRDGKICEAFYKNKTKNIKCLVIKNQLNNFDKILFNKNKLKLKVIEPRDLYAVRCYEEIMNE